MLPRSRSPNSQPKPNPNPNPNQVPSYSLILTRCHPSLTLTRCHPSPTLALTLPKPNPNQVLPKSRSPHRLKENLDLGHLDLSADEMEAIRTLDQARPQVSQSVSK